LTLPPESPDQMVPRMRTNRDDTAPEALNEELNDDVVTSYR
jgi:hypothetical protein